ncbi:hypothetical protein PMAYCL1PPCAC_27124, partial [Pristionchus mayeri]
KHYGVVQADFSVYTPAPAKPRAVNSHISIDQYRQLLLDSKPRHTSSSYTKPFEMNRFNPIFPQRPSTSTHSYFVDLEPVAMRTLGTCRARYSSCKTSSACLVGVLCRDSEGPCCRPHFSYLMDEPSSTCPTPDILTPQCNKRLGVSWCEKDRDCHTPIAKRKCCPTACNYNICV